MGETVDNAVETVLDYVQADVEARLDVIVRDVQARVLDALDQRRFGMLLIGFGIGLALLSSLLLTFALVYVLVNVFNLPIWIGYLSLGGLFALSSMIFLVIGRRQLPAEQ